MDSAFIDYLTLGVLSLIVGGGAAGAMFGFIVMTKGLRK